jgi:hypothetical protein
MIWREMCVLRLEARAAIAFFPRGRRGSDCGGGQIRRPAIGLGSGRQLTVGLASFSQANGSLVRSVAANSARPGAGARDSEPGRVPPDRLMIKSDSLSDFVGDYCGAERCAVVGIAGPKLRSSL